MLFLLTAEMAARCWCSRWDASSLESRIALDVEVDRCAVGQEEDAVELVVLVEQCWWCCLIEMVVADLEADGKLVELVDDVVLVDDKRLMLRKNRCPCWSGWCWHHCWWHGHVDVLLLLMLVVEEVAVVVLDAEEQAFDVVDQALLNAVEVVTCWARCSRLCWFSNGSGRWEMNRRKEMIAVMMIPVVHLRCRCVGLLLRCGSSSSSSSFIFISPFSSFFLTSSFVLISSFFFVVAVSLLMSSFLLSLLPSSCLMSCGCLHRCRGCCLSSSSFVVLVVRPVFIVVVVASLSLMHLSHWWRWQRGQEGLWWKMSSSSHFLLSVEGFGDDFQRRTLMLPSCCSWGWGIPRVFWKICLMLNHEELVVVEELLIARCLSFLLLLLTTAACWLMLIYLLPAVQCCWGWSRLNCRILSCYPLICC